MEKRVGSLSEAYFGGDYESEFEFDNEADNKRKKCADLALKPLPKHVAKPSKHVFTEECSREQGRIQRSQFLSLDAYTKHKTLINQYVLCYPGSTSYLKRDTSKDKTDHDVIKENHRFLWEEDESADTWEKQLAKKYYDKLFKEYCITDLRYYKENKIAMRWRTKQEVIVGKGQFSCGHTRCNEKVGLKSWEVNFSYAEQEEKKNALVKVRLCPECSYKLNYRHKRTEVTKLKKSTQYENPSKRFKSDLDSENSTLPNTSTDLPSCAHDDSEKGKTIGQEDIWKQPVQEDVLVSKEDEFEQYLADVLL